jgi:hypothetical protein
MDNDAAGVKEQERIIREYTAPVLEEDDRDYSDRCFIDWRWLRVHRHFGYHFDEQELVFEIRLPWFSYYGFNAPGWRARVGRAYVIVFGRAHTRLAMGAWHIRGCLSTWHGEYLH